MSMPTIQECAEAIKLPVEEWESNCYAVALAIRNAGIIKDVEPRYGHYFGYVHPDSCFGDRSLPPRHGWLEIVEEGIANGTIIDPTLWVFLNTPPVLAVIPPFVPEHGFYDLGGEAFLAKYKGAAIPTEAELEARGEFYSQRTYHRWPKSVRPLLRRLFGRPDRLMRGHVIYLANRGPQFLGKDAKPIYETIVAAGEKSWIPIDYRNKVLGEKVFRNLCSCEENECEPGYLLCDECLARDAEE